MNAFDMLQQIPAINFQVIFTTAYDQYAIRAIRFSALDYLLKPIDADELKQAVKKAAAEIQFIEKTQVEQLKHNLADPAEDFKLIVSTSEGSFFIPPADIVYCEGQSNYTWFHLTRNRKMISSKTLKEFENILVEHKFVRIHKSFLVNINYIEKFSAAKTAVILTDKTSLEVSRRRKDEVVNALFNK